MMTNVSMAVPVPLPHLSDADDENEKAIHVRLPKMDTKFPFAEKVDVQHESMDGSSSDEDDTNTVTANTFLGPADFADTWVKTENEVFHMSLPKMDTKFPFAEKVDVNKDLWESSSSDGEGTSTTKADTLLGTTDFAVRRVKSEYFHE